MIEGREAEKKNSERDDQTKGQNAKKGLKR